MAEDREVTVYYYGFRMEPSRVVGKELEVGTGGITVSATTSSGDTVNAFFPWTSVQQVVTKP